jgi:hypothetical protein
LKYPLFHSGINTGGNEMKKILLIVSSLAIIFILGCANMTTGPDASHVVVNIDVGMFIGTDSPVAIIKLANQSAGKMEYLVLSNSKKIEVLKSHKDSLMGKRVLVEGTVRLDIKECYLKKITVLPEGKTINF